ncbi:ABC transporter permease subunit, partial [Pseudomonas viridiflava]|uniref:ABC transporter permease subunit n=1 Tax=Pseudomonas viridiflava TaxID=33069 RepID=UPI000F0316A0
FYVWLFRSIPLLVLLVFVYNLPQLFPSTGTVLSQPFYSGLIALVLTETAYMAEIHRDGLLSVLKGQREAAKALGIRGLGAQRLVIIPQAIRIALPTLTNEYVTIVKLTSLVSVISLNELLLAGQRLYAQN